MRRQPSTDVLLFIPADIQHAYRLEAAEQVRQSWSARPLRARPVPRPAALDAVRAPVRVRSARVARLERLFVVLAVTLGLIGGAACTAWWAWLAYTTGSQTWSSFAVGGGVAVAFGLIALVVYTLQRK